MDESDYDNPVHTPEEVYGIVSGATNVVSTPEDNQELGPDGTFWLYSVGMKDNFDLPDLEVRGVPGMFVNTAASLINEINSYRLSFPDKPMIVGHRVSWDCGDILIEQGDDWEGAYEWKAKDMLRLSSLHMDVCSCHNCETAGVDA